MNNRTSIPRRLFIGAASAAFGITASGKLSNAQPDKKLTPPSPLRVGVLGYGPYSHYHFERAILGIGERRQFKTNMHISHVWVDDYRKNYTGKIWSSGRAAKLIARRSPEYILKNSDAQLVKNPEDMIGSVDAVMIIDFDISARLAEPFLIEGIPIYVNRPFAPTMSDGRKIMDMSESTSTAVFTGSLVPWIFDTRKIKAAVDRDKLFAFYADGLNASFCRYVPHGLEFIYSIVGSGVRRVRLTGWNGSNGYAPSTLPPIVIELEYTAPGEAHPLRGTLLLREKFPHDWWFRGYHTGGLLVEGGVPNHDGVSLDTGDDHWRVPFLNIIENVFRTNKSPETRDDILHKLATLLAAHKSAMEEGRWVGLNEIENHRLPTVIIEKWNEKI